MIETINDRYGEYKWMFMQDGASAHIAAATTWFLRSRCLVLPGWPPNSPDINPIEMVWSIVKARVRREQPTSLKALKRVNNQV
jgi:transposase